MTNPRRDTPPIGVTGHMNQIEIFDTPNLPETGYEKLKEMVAEKLEHAPGRIYLLNSMKQMVEEHETALLQRDNALRLAKNALSSGRRE